MNQNDKYQLAFAAGAAFIYLGTKLLSPELEFTPENTSLDGLLCSITSGYVLGGIGRKIVGETPKDNYTTTINTEEKLSKQ